MSRLLKSAPTDQAPAPAGTYRRVTPSLFAVVRHKVWSALEAQGQRRAAAELRSLAQRWQSIDPQIAQRLREAAAFDTTTTTPRPAAAQREASHDDVRA